MIIPTKALKNGFEIPEISLGTWPMGGYRSHDPENDDARDIDAIKYSIEQGITSFDSAEMYAGGYAETLLGKGIQGYKREELFISTKVRGSNCSYNAIKNACKNSLKRLDTPYIDLYYIHWRDKNFSLEECMKAMNELKEEGLIKNIGVSNFTKESLEEAQSYCKHQIVANQVHYNLIFREPEVSGLLEYCQRNDIMLVAWRPIELGKLAHVRSMYDMATQYGKKFAQISINWLISQPNVVTVFKSSDRKHIDENLGGTGWNMSLQDIEEYRRNFPGQINVSDGVPLG